MTNSLIIQIHETCIVITIIGWGHAHKCESTFTKNEGIPIMESLSQSRCGVHDGETDPEFVLGHPFWVTVYAIGGPDFRSKRHISFIDFMIKEPSQVVVYQPLLATWHSNSQSQHWSVPYLLETLRLNRTYYWNSFDNRVDNHTFHMQLFMQVLGKVNNKRG